MGERKLVTHHEYPPIPIRRFDWCAHWDDEEGACGHGATEEDAIMDLIMNYELPSASMTRSVSTTVTK